MATRWVVVDDSSPRISYRQLPGITDPMTDQPEPLELENEDDSASGHPFMNTLHIPPPQSSEGFISSFEYEGSDVTIYVTDTGNTSAVYMSSCMVDSAVAPMVQRHQIGLANNLVLCMTYGLQDGHHTVEVVSLAGIWLLLDRIEYVPSSNASLEDEYVRIDDPDPSIAYGEGWEMDAEDGRRRTKGSKSTLEFEFTGVSMAWYGAIPGDTNTSSSSATYSLDDGSPQTFDLPRSLDKSKDHQKFFETPILPMAKHRITVAYDGGEEYTPLILDYLIIKNGSLANLEPASTKSHSPEPGTTTDSYFSHKEQASETPNNVNSTGSQPTNVGVLVGSILAAVIVALVLISLCIFFRHRIRRQSQSDPLPFTATPSSAYPPSQAQHNIPETLDGDSVATYTVRRTPTIKFLTQPTQSLPPWMERIPPESARSSSVPMASVQFGSRRQVDERRSWSSMGEIPPAYTPG